jgi:hypothetical protein
LLTSVDTGLEALGVAAAALELAPLELAALEPAALEPAALEPAAAGAAGTPVSCALTTPPSSTRPAQLAVHRYRHDFRSITFPRESDDHQIELHNQQQRFGCGYCLYRTTQFPNDQYPTISAPMS